MLSRRPKMFLTMRQVCSIVGEWYEWEVVIDGEDDIPTRISKPVDYARAMEIIKELAYNINQSYDGFMLPPEFHIVGRVIYKTNDQKQNNTVIGEVVQ